MERKPRHIPQINERFGRLVVIREGEPEIDQKTQKRKSRYWCQCDCGSPEKLIRGASLVDGTIQSCGCLHKEVASETAKTKISHGKKYNKYDLTGKYGIGYTSDNLQFYFDLEDYDKIKDIYWSIDNRGYVFGHLLATKKSVKMHNIIMPHDRCFVVDHINTHMKNDNRKSNLRITTQQNNTMNRKTPSNNTSGTTGVAFDKRKNKWIAYIGYNKHHKILGAFINKEDAIMARKIAEELYFKEYSYDNSIKLSIAEAISADG